MPVHIASKFVLLIIATRDVLTGGRMGFNDPISSNLHVGVIAPLSSTLQESW